MPSDVKDWVLTGPPGRSTRASAAFESGSSDDDLTGAHVAFSDSAESDSDDEADQFGYYTMSV
jgi:hypothetical protein